MTEPPKREPPLTMNQWLAVVAIIVVLLFAFGILGCQVTVKPETAPHNLQEELFVSANS